MNNNSQPSQQEGLLHIFGLQLNKVSQRHLGTIATWAIIAGSLGFLALVFMGVAAYQTLRMIIINEASANGLLMAIVALITVAMNLLLNIFLMRLGILLKRALANQSQEQWRQGLIYLRNYMRSLGAYLIIGIVVAVLGTVVTLAIRYAQN